MKCGQPEPQPRSQAISCSTFLSTYLMMTFELHEARFKGHICGHESRAGDGLGINEARFSQVSNWFLTTEFCQNAKQDGIMIGLLPRPNNPRVDCFKYLYGEDRSCDLCGGICSSMKCQFHLHMTWFLLYKFHLHVYSGALHSLRIPLPLHGDYGNIVLTWFDKERLLTAVIVRFFTVTNQAFAACHH